MLAANFLRRVRSRAGTTVSPRLLTAPPVPSTLSTSPSLPVSSASLSAAIPAIVVVATAVRRGPLHERVGEGTRSGHSLVSSPNSSSTIKSDDCVSSSSPEVLEPVMTPSRLLSSLSSASGGGMSSRPWLSRGDMDDGVARSDRHLGGGGAG
jgi:hypothetical protein